MRRQHFYILDQMILTQKVFPLFFLGLFVLSCEPPVQSVDETDPIENIQFTYMQEDQSIFVAARLKDPFNGVGLDFVTWVWYGKNGFEHSTPDSTILNDNGDFGDILRGDDTYSWKIDIIDLDSTNSLVYEDTGTVYLTIIAQYKNDSSYSLSDSLSLGNIIPQIVSIDAPDTLFIPTSGYDLDTLKVTVTDANGVEDIRWAAYKSLKPNGTYANNGNLIFLYDDGGDEILYQSDLIRLTSGDSVAGDGIFSYILLLFPNTLVGTYVWTFYAQDLSYAYSIPVEHTVIVQ